jgi:hypothetical protein
MVGLWFGVGLISPWLIFWLASGLTPIDLFNFSMANHLILDRPYVPWLWLHFWEWALLTGVPAYAIWKGGKRAFYLESDRYDYSEYQGKLVGILEADGPMERTGLGFRVYRVVRLEILERHPDEDKLGK